MGVENVYLLTMTLVGTSQEKPSALKVERRNPPESFSEQTSLKLHQEHCVGSLSHTQLLFIVVGGLCKNFTVVFA